MLNVRELPPLRLHALITSPNGNTFRWGQDERRPENVYSGLTFSTTMPGGFESADCSLPRKTGVNYQDLTMLSTLQIKGAGGSVAGEYRLEKTPRVSDLTQRTISPQLVGWQAHLDDDPEASVVFLDRDLTHWIPSTSAFKQFLYAITVVVITDPSVDPDMTTGIPALNLTTQGTGAASLMQSEAWYDSGPGDGIASIYYDMISQSTVAADTSQLGTASTSNSSASESRTADLITGTNSTAVGTHTPSPTTYRFARIFYQTASTGEADHSTMFRRLTVWGNTGIAKRGIAPDDGLLASDAMAFAVSAWCPRFQYTSGSNGTVRPSSFTIPQLEFRDSTTVSDIITQANRFSLGDWAVWENPFGPSVHPTFFYNDRGARGKKWRARVRPSNLSETGPQVDRLWNGVIVTFQDVDGTTKSVGPTGAQTDTTDATLLDTDPLNPINQMGLKRYARLDMGIVSTAAGATEVGRQFLVRAKDLDQSGAAEIVGHCQDANGVMRPAYQMRAGDQISFTDAADTSYRRIVHTSYDHDTRTNSIDLDSPPQGMDALLEQLGASLTVGTSTVSAPAGFVG